VAEQTGQRALLEGTDRGRRRAAGASAAVAANVGLAAAVVLLAYDGWSASGAAHLAGRARLAATSVAAAMGLVMVVLKDLVLIHMH
jgi:hypothetical protein